LRLAMHFEHERNSPPTQTRSTIRVPGAAHTVAVSRYAGPLSVLRQFDPWRCTRHFRAVFGFTEQNGLQWYPAFRPRLSVTLAFASGGLSSFLHNAWVFEAGDDLDGTAAAAKGFDVDGSQFAAKHTVLQPRRRALPTNRSRTRWAR
jgi:hypothetical protein